jgi:hypothetical protein
MWFDYQENGDYMVGHTSSYRTIIPPPSSSRNQNQNSSFLSNVLNENFSVEQLLNQYNRDLTAILEEQREKEEEELEGTTDIIDLTFLDTENPKENEKDKNKDKDKETNLPKSNSKSKKMKKEKSKELDISLTEAEFLQKLLSIKKKIAKLYKEYNLLKGQVNELDIEIKDINKIKDNNTDLNESLNQCFFTYCMEKDHECEINLIHERGGLICSLMDKIINIKQENKDEKIKKMDELTNTILMFKKIIDYKNDEDGNIIKTDDNMCTICVEDKRVQYCMEPCGHLFCESCTQRINNICHICRNRVNKKIRIYF